MPRVFNREQRRPIDQNSFSISELQRALDRLKKGVVPGVDGLPTEAYQRLTLPVKRRLAARLWDIVTGATPIPHFEGAGYEKAGCRGTYITKTQFTACVCTKMCHFS